VGDVDERHVELLVQVAELAPEPFLEHVVERPERLVQQEHVRVVRDCSRERDTLLLPAAQFVGALLCVLGRVEANLVQELLDFAVRGPALRLDRELDVLADGHVGKQRPRLEHRARRTLLWTDTGEVVAVEQDRPGGRLEMTGDHVQHRRLAGPTRPHQGDELARFDLDREVLDRDEVAELFSYVAELYHGSI
jgi:hypothetical protein